MIDSMTNSEAVYLSDSVGLLDSSESTSNGFADHAHGALESVKNLSFRDITYSVKIKKNCLTSKSETLTILKDVSGVFRPGLNAIMGPTGGGKTTLLELLSDRKKLSPDRFQGQILLNEHPLPQDFSLICGFVPQDDVMMGSLTVQENIMLAANLRIKRRHSKYGSISESIRRTNHVEKIIRDLGLEKVKNSRVGTDLIKGISGGEKKRCNIGMELVTQPKILFLDEPTTGLDASTSNSVISTLRDLSRQGGGRIIIFTIHQPRFSIFRLFNTLHLFSSYGQTVYHGEAQKAMEYFENHGFHCEVHNNPADFLLDIILQNSPPAKVDSLLLPDLDEIIVDIQSPRRDLAAMFKDYKNNLTSTQDNFDVEMLDLENSLQPITAGNHSVSWCWQVYYLSERSVKNLIRNPRVAIIPSLMMVFSAILVGCLYLDVEFNLSGFQNLLGALFFISLQGVLGNIASVEVFISDRSLFMHESCNGFYGISAFFFAKIFADLLPLRAIPTVLFSVVFYYMVGFRNNFWYMLYFVFINILTAMSACSLAFLVSISTGVFSVALAVIAVIYVAMVAFSGIIVNIADIPALFKPLKYLSIPRYCLSAHAIAQIDGHIFCGNTTTHVNGAVIEVEACEKGSDILEAQGISVDSFDEYLNVFALIALTVFYFSLTYVILRLTPKKK